MHTHCWCQLHSSHASLCTQCLSVCLSAVSFDQSSFLVVSQLYMLLVIEVQINNTNSKIKPVNHTWRILFFPVNTTFAFQLNDEIPPYFNAPQTIKCSTTFTTIGILLQSNLLRKPWYIVQDKSFKNKHHNTLIHATTYGFTQVYLFFQQ